MTFHKHHRVEKRLYVQPNSRKNNIMHIVLHIALQYFFILLGIIDKYYSIDKYK